MVWIYGRYMIMIYSSSSWGEHKPANTNWGAPPCRNANVRLDHSKHRGNGCDMAKKISASTDAKSELWASKSAKLWCPADGSDGSGNSPAWRMKEDGGLLMSKDLLDISCDISDISWKPGHHHARSVCSVAALHLTGSKSSWRDASEKCQRKHQALNGRLLKSQRWFRWDKA
jgi:hypothetical protein